MEVRHEEEPYEPREHDHLVEPMFGGLGAERRPPRRPGRFDWLMALLRRWLSRLRP